MLETTPHPPQVSLSLTAADTPLVPLNERRPLDRDPAAVYLARLAAGSRRAMRQALEVIVGVLVPGEDNPLRFPWGQLRYQHVQAVRAELARRYASTTVNKMLSALRGVLTEAFRLGYLDAEAFERMKDVANVRGHRVPPGRSLTAGELRSLLEDACDLDTLQGARNAAIVAVLYGVGLRRAELVDLDLADITPATDTDTMNIKVRGKGSKERVVHATGGVKRALAFWLGRRGDEPGPVFVRMRKGDKLVQRKDRSLWRLSEQAVFDIARRLALKCGIAKFSPHDLRRSCISDLLDAGADLVVASKLAGHAQVSTTARYDRRGERAVRHAAELLHVPFARDLDHRHESD